jgi:hypothetical protein
VTNGRNVAVYTYAAKGSRHFNGGSAKDDGWYLIWSHIVEPMEQTDYNNKFPDYYTTEEIIERDQLCQHVTSLKSIKEEIRSYLDTGYDSDVEISNTICGKIDNEIKAISDPACEF